jgi:proline iminopeptidase
MRGKDARSRIGHIAKLQAGAIIAAVHLLQRRFKEKRNERSHDDRRDMTALRDLYPAIEPYASGHLEVDEIHALYWEECGNPAGIPVLFLHGGPGGGCSAASRRFFDPQRYRVILFDQRGAGRSTPNGELRNNTPAHLIADLERLRKLRKIGAWHVFGGSWGATLAVAYAQEFAQACLSLTLRGIFLMREWEIRWIFEAGRRFRPEAWEALLAGLPPELQGADPLQGYAKLLEHPEHSVRLAAARRWCVFEATLANLIPDSMRIAGANEPQVAYAMARIEVHYFRNNRYEPEDQLIRRVGRIGHLPATIVQGRYDLLCPPATAIELHRAWPGSRLILIDDAGHSASEPGIRSALVTVMDEIAARDMSR